ncbi:MAG: hypothetical protein GXY34_07190 [Syntrophomonadaceae bacterium]|nr:hypothetical protein [Syntrophomonadaceae bacterium]
MGIRHDFGEVDRFYSPILGMYRICSILASVSYGYGGRTSLLEASQRMTL